MKEFDESPLPIETRVKDEERTAHRIIGELCSKPGLILFEFDEATGQIVEAEIKEEQVQVDTTSKRMGITQHADGKHYFDDNVKAKVTVHKKVIYKKGCTYLQAINRDNAIRKLNKIFKEK